MLPNKFNPNIDQMVLPETYMDTLLILHPKEIPCNNSNLVLEILNKLEASKILFNKEIINNNNSKNLYLFKKELVIITIFLNKAHFNKFQLNNNKWICNLIHNKAISNSNSSNKEEMDLMILILIQGIRL